MIGTQHDRIVAFCASPVRQTIVSQFLFGAVGVAVAISGGRSVLADDSASRPTPPGTSPSTQPATVPSASEPALTPEAARLKRLSLEDLMNVEVATESTASKTSEKVTEAPATAIVITQNDIQLRGYRYLKDVLRDLPGMETTENYFSEIGTNVPVRGLSGNNQIIVLVNGMRVNPPGGEYFPFRSDFSVMGAEQVEVIYGPGSTLYGQDAVSAVINVKTKPPVEGKLGELALDGGLYSERDVWTSFGKTFGADNQISLTGYFSYHDSDLAPLASEYPGWYGSFLGFAEEAKPHGLGFSPDREDFGLNGFARLEGPNWSIQAWVRQSERSSGEGYTEAATAKNSFFGLGYLPEAKWSDRSIVVEARNTLPIADNLKLDTAVTVNHYQILGGTRYIEPEDIGTKSAFWNFSDFKSGEGTSFSLEDTLRWQVAPTLSVIAGGFIGAYDITPKYTVLPGEQFTYLAPNGSSHTISAEPRDIYQTYAGYMEANWQIMPKLKAIAGTRVTSDTRLSETPVTPRASLIYSWTDAITAKYIYTQAFIAPAPYFDAAYDRGDVLAQPNPHGLKSEKATSNEINLEYNQKNFDLGVSAYYGRQSDLILVSDGDLAANQVYNSPIMLLGPNAGKRTLVETVNGGSSHNDGFDLYGRANFGNISPWFSYSYVDFAESLPGGTTQLGLPGISRHNGRLGATWAVTHQLFITPSLVIRSRPENVTVGTTTLGHDLDLPYEIDLHVEYHPQPHLQFYAEIRNLTNHKYALGDFAGSAVPQETINGVVGMRLEF